MSAATPSLRVRSFAKINLALAVLGKRPDGYHDVRTILQTIDLCDELEIRAADRLELRTTGDSALALLPVEDNLVWKAASALRQAAGARGGAEVVLHKRIPAGAGLGGGSSNAAAALLGLCRHWGLRPASGELWTLASGLGSDVPFFLEGGTALGEGRGDVITPLADCPPSWLVVVFPGIPIATAEAYRSLRPGLTSPDKTNRIQSFCSQGTQWTGCLTRIFNDFETSILPAYPEVREAKQLLVDAGATAALLSGSGSSVFGLFLDEESALAASRRVRRETWRSFPAKTLSRAEYLPRVLG